MTDERPAGDLDYEPGEGPAAAVIAGIVVSVLAFWVPLAIVLWHPVIEPVWRWLS